MNSGEKTIYDGLTNFLGEEAFMGGNFGIKGLLSAGFDPMEQFVGGFSPEIISDGEYLTFIIENTTSFESGSYRLGPNWDRSSFRPGSNMTQYYIFWEPIDYNRLNN